MPEIIIREDLVGKIVATVDEEIIAGRFKDALYRVSDAATDALTDYLKDEYRLQLDEYIERRAEEMVCNLLKGDTDEAKKFELIPNEFLGHPSVTDNHGVRAAIVEQFKDQILNAETIALRDENNRMREDLKIARGRY
jgi:hypothetical protein